MRDRSEKEIDRLINFCKENIQYFRNNKDTLTYADYRLVAQQLIYKEFEPNSVIYSKGDTPEHFYVVLNGKLAQVERNPAIDDWDWAWKTH